MTNVPTNSLQHSPLGQATNYPSRYQPELLFGIPRADNRGHLTIPTNWFGADIWNAYEMSWLNSKGKPVVAIGRFEVPWHSPRLIESKSLKLYLNSFNEEKIDSPEELTQRIQQDLSTVAGASVQVTIQALQNFRAHPIDSLSGTLIDELDVEIEHYTPQENLLKVVPDASLVSETLRSDLLKSNCLVTNQPDWGSVQIQYIGPQIDHSSLLAYIVSLRHHNEFHEHCVERLYNDIWQSCQPEKLFVYARYTRRGGLDINPWRANYAATPMEPRLARQ